ncbi:MAG: hypothetical protein V3S69_01110 [Dehalococcoidales bacterium]
MKVDIGTLKDTFQIGYEAYEGSRKEANEVWDMYHNRQWTIDQLALLANRGQPAETFNVVKLFARMLVGYYSTVVNTVRVYAAKEEEVDAANLLNDVINYVFRHNSFDTVEGDKIKLSGVISGIMVSYVDVKQTGEQDQFGRPLVDTVVHHVPDSEVVLDPMSRRDDYSDARFLHRFKWLPEDTVDKVFGKENREKLDAYHNHLDIDEAEFCYQFNEQFQGRFKVFNNYLIVHTVMTDDDGKNWSVYWSGDIILSQKEITFKETRWPYRVEKIQSSDRTEYYGVFREVIESQKAINQAIIKIQLMANTQKIFVEEGAVDNIAEFTNAVNRVNAVVKVASLAGVRVENLSREVLDQYTIVDKAFDRIQRILNINDSFLGQAFASDSGRKVKLQQNATIMGLRYLTVRIENFYHLLGWDVANLVKQYYTANQVLRIGDEVSGPRWIELNAPLQIWTGKFDAQGEPIMTFQFEEVLDPGTQKPMEDSNGNLILAPIPQEASEFTFTDIEVIVESAAFNDEDEKAQLMLETVLGGPAGQLLAQVNPAGYFKTYSLAIKSMKTKYSPDISALLEQTAAMLGDPQAAAAASAMAQGGGQQGAQQPKSSQLKLPQNTNEEF